MTLQISDYEHPSVHTRQGKIKPVHKLVAKGHLLKGYSNSTVLFCCLEMGIGYLGFLNLLLDWDVGVTCLQITVVTQFQG